MSGAQPMRSPFERAAATRPRPSFTVSANGFSQYTDFPASIAALLIAEVRLRNRQVHDDVDVRIGEQRVDRQRARNFMRACKRRRAFAVEVGARDADR